jgi:hypothetical protein
MLTLLGAIIVAMMIAVPIAWVVSESRGGRRLRNTMRILASIVMAAWIWGLSSWLTSINNNAWYGNATRDLIRTSIQQIEDGRLDRVLKIWRGLDQQYRPNYENRGRYDELVKEATARMRGEVPIEAGSAWDASVFSSETWLGHWEGEYGLWIVINDLGRPFDVVQSGEPRAKVHDVWTSPDFRILRFKEGDQWQHTLTLKNKYEAEHAWVDLPKGTIRGTRPMHRLIRASENQKAMTQQGRATNRSEPIRPETNHPSVKAGSDR